MTAHDPECSNCTGVYDPAVIREHVRYILSEHAAGRRSFYHAVDDLVGHVLFAYRHPAVEANSRKAGGA